MSWIEQAEVTTAEDKAERAKEQQRAQAKTDFDTDCATITAAYPERVRETFHKQLEEAKALDADPSANTPFLDALCAETDEDKTEKAQKIRENDIAYCQQVGKALGKFQKRLKQLDES